MARNADMDDAMEENDVYAETTLKMPCSVNFRFVLYDLYRDEQLIISNITEEDLLRSSSLRLDDKRKGKLPPLGVLGESRGVWVRVVEDRAPYEAERLRRFFKNDSGML